MNYLMDQNWLGEHGTQKERDRAHAYAQSQFQQQQQSGAPRRRNLDQNARLHTCCRQISEQLKWAGEWLDPEDWKRLFVAAVYGQKIVPSLEGNGFVVLNKKSSRMIVSECSEVLQYIECWAVEHGVKFSASEHLQDASHD